MKNFVTMIMYQSLTQWLKRIASTVTSGNYEVFMASKNTTKYLSNKQEKQVAKDIGGKTVIASGSLWGMKGDCRSDKYLIECKTTQKKSYRLTTETWEKINYEAIRDGLRTPIMCIEVNGISKAVVNVRHFNSIPEFNVLIENLPVTDCDKATSFLVRENDQIIRINTKLNKYSYTFKPNTLCVLDWDDFLEVIGE